MFVPTPKDPAPGGEGAAVAVQQTLEQIDFVHNMIARYPDTFAYCTTAADADAAYAGGRIASFIGMEGGESRKGRGVKEPGSGGVGASQIGQIDRPVR